jgi:hypothetical protein
VARLNGSDFPELNETIMNNELIRRRFVLSMAMLGVASLLQWNIGWSVSSPGAVEPYHDRWRFAVLIAVKRYQYACLAIFEALLVMTGFSRPVVFLKVLADPPSIFINWEILPEKQEELIHHLGLPVWLELRPIRIVEGETLPRYFLSLNIYKVAGMSGLLSEYFAEWSIYVGKAGGRGPASFLVVEVRHSMLSQDSVNGFVRGTALEHGRSRDHSQVISFVQFDTNSTLRSVLAGLDKAGDNPPEEVYLAREFIAANDLVYWRNGVADRTFCDARLVNHKLLSLDTTAHVTVEDSTYMAPFRKATPSSVLVFQGELNFVVSPWYNLDKPF